MLDVSHLNVNVIGLRFGIGLGKDIICFARDSVVLSFSNIVNLVKKGVDFNLQVTILCD